MRALVNHHDFRLRAKRRLPLILFDFIEGGVEDERLLSANRRAFDAVTFRPRQATRVSPSLDVTVAGLKLEFPVMIAPCGPARFAHPQGDKALARAANALGTAHVVPHMGGHRLEDVRAASSGLLLYQIYNVGGREITERAVMCAAEAGYQALVVTIDNPGMRRERDERNRMNLLLSGSLVDSWAMALPLLAHPRWLTGFMADGMPTSAPNARFPNGSEMKPDDIMRAMAAGSSTFDWSDLSWLRNAWNGPLILKGVLTPADAKRAVEEGADAIVISNHGGRSLDSLPPTLDVLPGIADAVGDRIDLILDSGVRRGSDVVKALALGARAVLVGRLTLYALALGEDGVTQALTTLRDDIRRTMIAIGCDSIAALDRSYVRAGRIDEEETTNAG